MKDSKLNIFSFVRSRYLRKKNITSLLYNWDLLNPWIKIVGAHEPWSNLYIWEETKETSLMPDKIFRASTG